MAIAAPEDVTNEIDAEAEAAAYAHMAALEDAEAFDVSDSLPAPQPEPVPAATPRQRMDMPSQEPRIEYTKPLERVRSYQAPMVPPMQQAPAPSAHAASAFAAPPPPKDIRSLEDLYAIYPVGNGECYLRIERTQPKQFRGIPTCGTLCDVDEQIPMEEFSRRFGGQDYKVHVIGPVPGRVAADGSPLVKTLVTMDVHVQGPPVVGMDTVSQEEFMQQQPGGPRGRTALGMMGLGFAGGELESVQLARIQADREDRARVEAQREQMVRNQQPPQQVIDAATFASREAVAIARASADERVAALRDQNEQIAAALKARDGELQAMRERLSAAERSASDARQFTETEQIKRLTETHATEVSRLKDDYTRELNRIQNDSRDKLADESRRHTEERVRAEGETSRERDRMRADGEARESALRNQAEALRVATKEQYERALADIAARTAEQINNIKESRDREIEAIRSIEQSTTAVTKETSAFTTGSLKEGLAETKSEVERLRRENDALRKSTQKDPVTYLTEVESVARNLLGMVKPDEVEKEAATGTNADDTSWKAIVAKGLKGLVDGAPAIMQQVQQARAVNQAQAAQQQQAVAQMQGQPQMRALQQGAPQSMQQQMAPPQPQRRQILAPLPIWAQTNGPPAPGAAVGMPRPFVGPLVGPPPMPLGRPVPSAVSVSGGGQAGGPSVPPMTGQFYESAPMVSPIQFDPKPPVAPPVAEAPQAAPTQVLQHAPQQQAAEPPTTSGLTKEHMMQFLDALNEHIEMETAPALFAQGLVAQIGDPGIVRDLVTKLSPKDLFDMLSQQGGGGSYIMTVAGRQYTEAVWAEARKLVGA